MEAFRINRWFPIASLGLLALTVGCHSLRKTNEHLRQCVPEPFVADSIPRELCKVTIPDYVLEPPDVLSIQAVKLVPKPPYRLNSLDTVLINVLGAPELRPIQGPYAIQPGGFVQLGFDYGMVKIAGMTIEEAQAAVGEQVHRVLSEDIEVYVSLGQIGNSQEISGEHLVSPDGKVNLGTYGRVRVVGLTIEEATQRIEEHLGEFLEDPQIAVDVFGYNSKSYYVIVQGAGLGDRSLSLPFTGNETVLDAISQIDGLTPSSSNRIWVARPGGNEQGGDQILPVDWLAISQRGATNSNFQLLPGDRIYVAENGWVAFDNRLAKVFAPIERIFGTTALGTSTTKSIRFWGTFGGGTGGGF